MNHLLKNNISNINYHTTVLGSWNAPVTFHRPSYNAGMSSPVGQQKDLNSNLNTCFVATDPIAWHTGVK